MDELNQKLTILENENLFLKEKNLQLTQILERQNYRQKEIEMKLSIHPVSGLPTHYQMNNDLIAFLEEEKRYPNHQWAFILIQLNQSYEMIKRTLKNSVSEWILFQLAHRLTESLQSDDHLYHSRENEFLIIHKYENTVELNPFIKLLILKIQEPHIFSGFNLALECNLGISLYPQDGNEKYTLLHRADIALGISQEQKVPYIIYQTDLQERVVEKMELQNAIIRAIEAPALENIGHQFELYFQPKLHLELTAPETVQVTKIAAEVLMRWNHPVRGAIAPSQFIPIAEETGLIMPIGKWSVYQVVKILRKWKDGPLKNISLSINISPRQFRSHELVEIIEKMIANEDLDASKLTLEVTETSLFEDPFSAMEFIKEFKGLGLKVSVDDFGTGYSSLSHLHKFTIDELKIDQSFTKGFPENPQDRAIIRSLISIAKELDLEIVAEGVEQSHQVKELLALGCLCIQGFVFSKPLNQDNFLDFVKGLQQNQMRLQLP